MVRDVVTSVPRRVAPLGLATRAAVVLLAAMVLAVGGVAVGLPTSARGTVGQQQRAAADAGSAAARVDAAVGAEAAVDAAVRGAAAAGQAGAQGVGGRLGAAEGNPAGEAASAGLARAREQTADTPARVPEAVGPGNSNSQRPAEVGADAADGAGPSEAPTAGAHTPAGPAQDPPVGEPQGPPSQQP